MTSICCFCFVDFVTPRQLGCHIWKCKMAQPNASQTGTLLSYAVHQNSICNVTTDNKKLQYLPNDNCYDNNDVADGNWSRCCALLFFI